MNFKRKLHNFKKNLITTLPHILAKKDKPISFIFTRLRILRHGQMGNEFWYLSSMQTHFYASSNLSKDLDKKGFCFLCSKHINSKENRKQKFPKVCYGGNTTYVPYTMFVVYGEFLLINVNTHFILKICRCYFHKQIVYSQ